MLMRHPRSLRIRQLAAPALVGGLAVSAAQLAAGRWRGAALPVLYAGACAIAAARLGGTLPDRRDRARAAAAFAVMHLAWGAGFVAGRPAAPSPLSASPPTSDRRPPPRRVRPPP